MVALRPRARYNPDMRRLASIAAAILLAICLSAPVLADDPTSGPAATPVIATEDVGAVGDPLLPYFVALLVMSAVFAVTGVVVTQLGAGAKAKRAHRRATAPGPWACPICGAANADPRSAICLTCGASRTLDPRAPA